MDKNIKCSHGNCRNDAAWREKNEGRFFCSQHAPLHRNAGGFDPIYQDVAPPPKSTEIKPRDPKWDKWDEDLKRRLHVKSN